MSQIIDKRHNGRHKSAVNRRRFIERFKKQIRQSVATAVANRSMTDFEHGEKITIPNKDTTEPIFKHGLAKHSTIVLPGNKNFSRGDKIPRPTDNNNPNASQASNTTEHGEDSFGFEISREEFLEIFFDDLELPNLIKKHLGPTKTIKPVRAGFTSTGAPTNLNLVRTMRHSLARRIAMRAPKKHALKQAEAELNILLKNNAPSHQIATQKDKIAMLSDKIKNIPFIDPFDLKYNRRILQPMPTSKAVVFCIMDVSGSMDAVKKDLAKRFFILLYLFLTKTYETIEIVFIRHHTSAKEVSEQDFFYSRETGGTVVSSALELMGDIIHDRYPTTEWNIYGAQASDGDNWQNDSPYCKDILINKIMPYMQYFAYLEIMPRNHQSLWDEYTSVKNIFPNFAMQHITNMQEIYPIFRELFKRQQIL